MDPNPADLPCTGSKLRQARRAAGLSQDQLARRLGKTNTTISHWEAGRKAIPDLDAVARALGLTRAELEGEAPLDRFPGTAKRIPIPDGPAPAERLGYLNLTGLLRWLDEVQAVQGRFPFKVTPDQVYRWLADPALAPPFPAYHNLFRRNLHGEPTLLFRPGEVLPWLQARIAANVRPCTPAGYPRAVGQERP
jgi:transcriptional regulator with XRE-family HTH domain